MDYSVQIPISEPTNARKQALKHLNKVKTVIYMLGLLFMGGVGAVVFSFYLVYSCQLVRVSFNSI